MTKGKQVAMFTEGQHVQFRTNIGHKVFNKEADAQGKMVDVFVRNLHIDRIDTGRIVKLHKSGKQGVAEIIPDNPLPSTESRKISRRLQFVTAV